MLEWDLKDEYHHEWMVWVEPYKLGGVCLLLHVDDIGGN